jgi:hypothetical protein
VGAVVQPPVGVVEVIAGTAVPYEIAAGDDAVTVVAVADLLMVSDPLT